MKASKILSLLAFFVLVGITIPVMSQTNPQNLSNIRVDDLNDDQIRAMMRQIEASGLGEAQLEQVAQARGMRPEEIAKLRQRVNKIKEQDKKGASQQDPNAPPKSSSSGRDLNFETDTVPGQRNPETEADKALMELRSKIFGADLFRNSNLTFEPNLSMATPKNYVIGPNDELLIDIYGNNEVSYNLRVSPDGNINVEYVGVIPVSGLTIEAATSRIRSRLATVYGGLRNGSTNLNVALGNIRSIKVILTGEITKPGTYTLPSLANLFNALYSSGGPTENGSFRAIELIRGGKKVATLDIYDFLMRGEMAGNLRLQDQDIIRVPVYKSRIEIVGEVKRPGIFELLNNESFRDLLNFAGDFNENAFKARVKVLKNTDTERRIADLTVDQFTSYRPTSGDKFFVDRVLERFANRVSIDGAVFRPGQYELEPGLTLSGLIRKAEGIKEDAFLPRGYITRLRADNQPQILSFSVSGILDGTTPDIPLFREDLVNISSIFDLKEEYVVTIDGEVRRPGAFSYAEGMTLEELILKAGGLTEAAATKRIDVARRVKDSNISSTSAETAQVFQIDIDRNLNFSSPKFQLQPFDIVSVRSSIGYEIQRQVKVEGEVLYPGTYTITNRDERVSDLLKRAGGLTALAYVEGASLKREGPSRLGTMGEINTQEEERDKIATLQRLQKSVKDSLDVPAQEILKNVYVGIELDKIIENPGGQLDLILEEGDILRIPKQLQTVKVNGEILYPVTTIFNENRGFKYYVSQGGGFSDNSLKRRSYVIYANGAVKSTSKILFFNNYPKVDPGAEIFVPKKEFRQGLSAQELLGITTGIASLGAIILGIINLSSPN